MPMSTQVRPAKITSKQLTIAGVESIDRAIRNLPPHAMDGVLVMVNIDEGKVYIDIMDWGESRLVKSVINAAENAAGKDNVRIANEELRPHGPGWRELKGKLMDRREKLSRLLGKRNVIRLAMND